MEITTDSRINELKAFMETYKNKEHAESGLIAVLHKAQELYGYLDRAAMHEISKAMRIPTAHIWGVATFYHYFNLKPRGKYVISVCMGTACFIKGADQVLETLKKELQLEVGGTTDDKLFTLQEARCLGACGLAPVVMVNDKIHGLLDAKKTSELLKHYRKQEEKKAKQA